MRLTITLALVLGSVSLAHAQQQPRVEIPKDPEPRYGVASKPKVYPQATAKQALESAINAVERTNTAYLVAHIMDPAFVDAEVAERAKQVEPAVETELARQRDFQIRNLEKFPPETRLPTEREPFKAVVAQQSRDQAFRKFVRDVENKLLNDPQTLKDFKKILRDGTITDNATGAKATHPDVKERALFFRKIDDRWFLENRQDETAPKKE